jgi:hypothetical protein
MRSGHLARVCPYTQEVGTCRRSATSWTLRSWPFSVFSPPVAAFAASVRNARALRLHRTCAGNSHLPCGFLRLHSTGIASGLLQGAGHAVLETLYSRAHRIGLDGVSWLLDGLSKNISFGFFVVVVVCVLVCPALEVVILVEEQLQGFCDHVGRRSLDELRIELQLSLYRFFDTGLDGYCFWLFRWRFQN